MDDNAIVELYLKRNQRAISETKDKYGSRLRSQAKRITADDFTADECENDTYMQAWNSIPPNEPRTYLYAYLARIVRHIALNRCEMNNAQKRQAYLVDIEDEMEQCIAAPDDTEKVIDDLVFKESIDRFLSKLDEDKRNIFVRRYFFMDDIKEIAERYDYSESKIKSMLMRLREKLREHFEKDGIFS
ncbi:MAG: RNA polymerase sigma factor [Oscillospiraceae bacterium]|nr:RNA polymerase sigma factor [Oscillospiraceae bacterium]